jgi:hypothetical protein
MKSRKAHLFSHPINPKTYFKPQIKCFYKDQQLLEKILSMEQTLNYKVRDLIK